MICSFVSGNNVAMIASRLTSLFWLEMHVVEMIELKRNPFHMGNDKCLLINQKRKKNRWSMLFFLFWTFWYCTLQMGILQVRNKCLALLPPCLADFYCFVCENLGVWWPWWCWCCLFCPEEYTEVHNRRLPLPQQHWEGNQKCFCKGWPCNCGFPVPWPEFWDHSIDGPYIWQVNCHVSTSICML